MRIAEVMTSPVLTVSEEVSLREAAEKMARGDVGSIPVMRDGKLVGIVTDRDVAIRAVAAGLDAETTTVGDVMTSDVAWCRESEPVENAAELMEERQIRRMIVLDAQGRICGIVSLGDLALRCGDEELTEEVLEEVSWPGHSGGARPLTRTRGQAWSGRNGARAQVHHDLLTGSHLALAVGGFAAGAMAMYFLDPARGRRRQVLLRDKLIRAAHQAQSGMGKTARYARGQAQGLLAETRSTLRSDHPSDAKLRERIRAAIGRAVSHPRAVEVDTFDGTAILSGPVLEHELDDLLATVRRVRGVHEIDNRLDARRRRGREPSLQGGGRRRRRAGLMQENWSPTVRLLGTIAAGSLAAWGLARRDAIGLGAATLGAAIGTRSLTNLPTRRLIGAGAGRRAIDVQKHINFDAPVERIFQYFADYANFPHFMSRVIDVRAHGNGRSHWTVKGPGGIPVSWDAQITRFNPNRIIAWRSAPGSTIENAGIIKFQENKRGGTRVDIKLSYNPPGGALGHAAAKLFGADPKSDMDADLMRLKTTIETGHAPHDAAQPVETRETLGV